MRFDFAFARDLREAARSLSRARVLATIAILTTGLGIGASAAVFVVVDAILLQPLPFPDAARLVRLWEGRPSHGEERVGMSPANQVDLMRASRAFDGIALYWSTQTIATLRDGSDEADVARVSRNLFQVLGVGPAIGPGFTNAASPYGSPANEIVLSHGVWQRHFGSDPAVIGTSILIEQRTPHRIVGVMPRGFDFPRGSDLWMADTFGLEAVREEKFRDAVGRLKAGVTLDAAAREVRAISARLATDHPAANRDWMMTIAPMQATAVAPVQPLLVLLSIAVACVTALAWSNVLGLLVGRAATRTVELAVRRALGGGTLQLLWAWIIEGLLLALAGGALGFLLASWLLPALVSLAPSGIPRIEEVVITPRTAAFALALSLASAGLFALAPLGVLRMRDLGVSLIHAGRTAVAQPRHRVRRALIVVQTMMTITLVFAAGLLVQAFVALQRTDLGFDADRLIVARVSAPLARFLPTGQMRPDWARVAQLYEQVTATVAAMPGVRTAAVSREVPLTGTDDQVFFRLPGTPNGDRQRLSATRYVVSPSYFEAMGIRLVSGRLFEARDRLADAELDGTAKRRQTGPALVNRALADRVFPGEGALGKTLALVGAGDRAVTRQIVGIVENVRDETPDAVQGPAIYVPFGQAPWFKQRLVVRTAGDPEALAAALRPALRAIDPDLVVTEEQTMTRVVEEARARPRFLTLTVTGFAAIGLLLALVGTYGFIAYLTTQREQEMGVRLAIGATGRQIAWLVMSDGVRLAAAGVALGALASYAVARGLVAAVPGVGAPLQGSGLVMFGVSLAVMIATVLAATYIPSRRAARIDPAIVLRRS